MRRKAGKIRRKKSNFPNHGEKEGQTPEPKKQEVEKPGNSESNPGNKEGREIQADKTISILNETTPEGTGYTFNNTLYGSELTSDFEMPESTIKSTSFDPGSPKLGAPHT